MGSNIYYRSSLEIAGDIVLHFRRGIPRGRYRLFKKLCHARIVTLIGLQKN